jgi:hypothetical protein
MRNSGISQYFEIAANMKGETERSLIKEFSINI